MKDNKIVMSIFAFLVVFSSLTYFLNPNRKIMKLESWVRNYAIEAYSLLPKVFAKEENIKLEEYLNSSLEEDNQQLKELLELNRTLSDFEYVNATVLYRNVSYWLDTITIDKGEQDGVGVNDSVVTKNGLIGKVVTVNKDNSVVSLLTTDDSYYVSVSVNGSNGLLYTYDKKEQALKVKGIDKKEEIKEGDAVLTNGLGGLFPKGLYIGKVKKIENDTYDLSKVVYVDVEQNFNDIAYVMVVGAHK